jgi:hypothetical protein
MQRQLITHVLLAVVIQSIVFLCIFPSYFNKMIDEMKRPSFADDSSPARVHRRLSLSQIEPVAFENGRFLPGIAMATNLFYNGTHFILFQDNLTEKNFTASDFIKEEADEFPFVILPHSERTERYETFKNISWILLGTEKFKGFVGHYFHFMEMLLAVWAAFDIHMKQLYPDHSDYHNWVENIVIGPKVNRTQWLKKNLTINEFITTAVAPNANVYTNNLPTDWIMFERAFLSERRGAARGNDIDVHKMSSGITAWAMKQDPLVFERFKKLVVSAANGKLERPPKRVDNKLEVLYISRQKNVTKGRMLTNESHTGLLNMLERDLKAKINVNHAKMELYTPAEQVQMISNADVIIGVHGNGLTNALWMPKGGLVIEMFPEGSCMFDYQWISTVSDQKYAGITGDIAIPSFTKFVKEPCRTLMRTGKVNQLFPVNVTLVKQVLSRHVSRGNVGLLTCSYTLRN